MGGAILTAAIYKGRKCDAVIYASSTHLKDNATTFCLAVLVGGPPNASLRVGDEKCSRGFQPAEKTPATFCGVRLSRQHNV